MIVLRCACLLLVTGLAGPAWAQDAVVKVYAERPAGTSQGTGFFASESGHIVTAYHVIEGGRRITVFHDALGSFTDIEVQSIAPAYDLAVLRIRNLVGETPQFRFDRQPAPGELTLRGYPRGGVLQEFRGRSTTAGQFVNSHTIRDDRQRRLFEEEIDVLPLDVSVYSGMSGGPVLGSRGVIGVLSGSYDEGGGIGWAIPAKYIDSVTTPIRRTPDRVTWPRLTLMAGAWRNLRASVILNAAAGTVFDEFVGEAETVARVLGEMYEQAGMVHINFLAHRPFLQRVIADPELREDWDEATALLRPTNSLAFSSFRHFLDLQSEFATVGRRLGLSLARVITWVNHESGLSEQRGQTLGRAIRDIRRQVADLRHGLDAYLGIDRDAVLQAVPALMQGLRETEGRAGAQAEVQLAFIEAWLPAIEKYASPAALLFVTRTVSANRQIARLFEPIVYQVQ